MTLLEFVLNEYMTIVGMLEKKEKVENNRIIISREYFKKLLEKYQYITFKDKTRIYKDLNLIIHDKTSYTMPYKDPELKKTVRKVIINYQAYKTIKDFNKKIEGE